MAGQRRGEPGVLRGRGRSRLARLALALSLLLAGTTACDEDGTPLSPAPLPGNGGTGGTGGTPTAAELLVGTWRTVVVVEVPGDVQTWTTTWRFGEDGRCEQTVETVSLVEGFPRLTERACSWAAGDFEVTIDFDAGATLELDFSFADFSPDRLVLDGFEYERLA